MIKISSRRFAIGDQLFKETQTSTPPARSISIHSISETRDDYNLIAESKGGDPNHVLVVDVAARGAGFLQSGSGVDLTVVAEMVYLGK